MEILHSGVAGDSNLLGRDALSLGLQIPTFRRTVATLLSSSPRWHDPDDDGAGTAVHPNVGSCRLKPSLGRTSCSAVWHTLACTYTGDALSMLLVVVCLSACLSQHYKGRTAVTANKKKGKTRDTSVCTACV
jgi:hypothetical protein